jgi:DNA-binding transcriptional ArsR family regulator
MSEITEGDFDYKRIDPILHSRIRLAIVALLMGSDEAEFSYIRDKVGATDGNMSTHLRQLEQASYVSYRKTFQGRKPLTLYALTDLGRERFSEYLRMLGSIVKGTDSP